MGIVGAYGDFEDDVNVNTKQNLDLGIAVVWVFGVVMGVVVNALICWGLYLLIQKFLV